MAWSMPPLLTAEGHQASALQGQPVELSFSGPSVAAPFTVRFEASVDGPSTRDFTLPGCYAGDGRWLLRLAPCEPGTWHLTTSSDEPALDGLTATIECEPSEASGAILVDPDSPRHFVTASGERWFYLGYRCDWLWALDADGPSWRTLEPLLETISRSAVTAVLLAAYAYDSPQSPGCRSDADLGPAPRFAWGGSPDQPDHASFDLAYWRHYDRVIGALAARGMAAQLQVRPLVAKGLPAAGSEAEERYLRWLVGRYGCYGSLLWDVPAELVGTMRRLDPYRRLVLSRSHEADVGLFESAEELYPQVVAAHAAHPRPVIDTAPGFEHGPQGLADRIHADAVTAEALSQRLWEVYLAGGYAAYAYTYGAADVIRADQTPRGLEDLSYLHRFFGATGYWQLRPADELVSRGHCLANPGVEYVAYVADGEPFTIRTHAELEGYWFRCLTGERRALRAPTQPGGKELWPPREWRSGPVALHLGSCPDEPTVRR